MAGRNDDAAYERRAGCEDIISGAVRYQQRGQR
jgi:hypothetical protein